jgi:hypothetical protein
MGSQGISRTLADEIQKRLPVRIQLTDEDFVVAAGLALKECPWDYDPTNSNDALLRALDNVDQ